MRAGMRYLQPPPPRLIQASLRSIHTTASTLATPLPGVSSPGPPPKPPQAPVSPPDERLARARRKVELLELGKTLRANDKPTSPSSTSSKPRKTLPKRFWRSVSVAYTEDNQSLQINLDTRPVRTTKERRLLRIPRSKPHLATAIALEWESLTTTQQALKSQYIPLTDLTSRTLDIEDDDAGRGPAGVEEKGGVRERVVDMFMGYLATDTLLCWAPAPSPLTEPPASATNTEEQKEEKTLRDVQIETAEPITKYLTTHVWPGVEINPVLEENSIVPTPQPVMTKQVIKGWVSGLAAWELAGLERAVLATKSACVAARLVWEWSGALGGGAEAGESLDSSGEREAKEDERFGIEEAAKACSLEVSWQTGMWGEVEDTHDVDREDLRRQLGSVVVLVSSNPPR